MLTNAIIIKSLANIIFSHTIFKKKLYMNIVSPQKVTALVETSKLLLLLLFWLQMSIGTDVTANLV